MKRGDILSNSQIESEIKMIVTDLDGTLLKTDKTVSDYTKRIIDIARKRGIKFVIATARPVRAVKQYLPFLEYDSAVYHNGAVVTYEDHVLAGFGIERSYQLANQILAKLPDSHIAIESNDIMYSNFKADELWPDVEYIFTSDFAELDGQQADKIIVEAHSIEEMNRLKKYLPDDLYIQLSEGTIAMIMNMRATKKNGIHALAKQYGLQMDNIVAFGDDYNDIEMLKACGVGVAVSNGLDSVKGFADYLCSSNDDDGVAKWIEANIL